jgi:hypothetical protein
MDEKEPPSRNARDRRWFWFSVLVIVPVATVAGVGWAWLGINGARALTVVLVGAFSGFVFFALLKLRERLTD